MKKGSAFRGLAAVCALLCAVACFITPVAWANAGNINTFLGLSAPTATASATTETMYFKTSYTEDGLLSEAGQAALLEAEDAYNIQAMEEGAVLARNEGGALPLQSGCKVTLFGSAAAKPITHGASDANRFVGFDQALSNAGFLVNTTVFNAYLSSPTERDLESCDIGEEPISFYTEELRESFSEYNDAAIVMLSRAAAEGMDLSTSDADGVPQLALHQNERDLLEMVQSSGFGKIIVIINSGYAMELGWLEEYNVDACLIISAPGLNGYVGVANLLTGAANFSGKLTDTYAANSLSSPAAQNMGDFTWANSDEISAYGKGTNTDKYLVQAEGIYTGYKYYETRYEDCVLGQGNAASTAGVFASEETWNYADEVVFPFGYGLSYTTFEQTLDSVTIDEATHTAVTTVTVTNTGNTAGKSVVELYAQTPYTQYDRDNAVEKSAIQLLDFAKTGTLEPGASETVTLTSDLYLIASYDENGAKGYIMDAGEYYLAIGDDAHDALNNILAAKGASNLCSETGAEVAGNAEKAWKWTQSELDTETYRYSVAGVEVTNRFDDQIDINDLMPGTVTWLSRSDWSGTWPEPCEGLSATSEMIPALDGNTYAPPSDAPEVSDFTQGKSSGLSFVDMKNIAYEDGETWDLFLNQLTLEELTIPLCDNFGIEAVTSVGKPYHQDKDGPEGIQATYPYGDDIACTIYVDPCVTAATWSKELLTLRGTFMGEDAIYSGVPFTWNIGANLHRTPYGGRNYQYFSECSTFTYYAGTCVTSGLTEKGVVAGIKHFAANDQETNRMGVATFMTEQTLRQNAFRGFEGAVTIGNTLGIMSSYNRFGCVPACQDRGVQVGILREEWGFQGINVTDAAINDRYMHSLEGLAAGSDMFCMQPARSKDFTKAVENGDGYILQCLRTANKNYYYAMSRSLLTNGIEVGASVEEFTPWWQPALIALDIAFALGCILCTFVYVRSERRKKEGNVV